MQQTPLQLEYTRAVVAERRRLIGNRAHTHPPPPPPGQTRQRAAATLARLAWRLDREAALRAWP
jgi:hypothetical protein